MGYGTLQEESVEFTEKEKKRLLRLRPFLTGQLAREECFFAEHKAKSISEKDWRYNRDFLRFIVSIMDLKNELKFTTQKINSF